MSRKLWMTQGIGSGRVTAPALGALLLLGLAAACHLARHPVVAIGGLDVPFTNRTQQAALASTASSTSIESAPSSS